jgi:hypothetical protein
MTIQNNNGPALNGAAAMEPKTDQSLPEEDAKQQQTGRLYCLTDYLYHTNDLSVKPHNLIHDAVLKPGTSA